MAELRVWDDTRNGGRCRSCGAPVTWCEMAATGRRMPFDGEPAYSRTYHDPATRRLVGVIDSDIHPSHFATCPQAAQWRRK